MTARFLPSQCAQPGGEILGVASFTQDISRRKQLEDALRASAERFRLIVENSPDVIALYDDQGVLVYVSPAFESTHGATAARALDLAPLLLAAIVTPPGEGPRAAELAQARTHPQYASRRMAAEAVAGCLQSPGARRRVEITGKLPSGETKYFAAAYQSYQGVGGSLRVVSITRDITDQKQYEQLLQDTNAVLDARVAARTAELQAALAELQRANQLKDEFMALISHELRTPLTGVLSLSELLAEQIAGPLNDRQATYVKGIVESGERLLDVVNAILGYTHLLSGKVRLDAAPCDLAYLFATCAASQQHKAAAKGQAIAVSVDPLDLAVVSDVTALAEVLKRLLDNAVKFTPEGGRIGLDAHVGAAANTVDLVVWDTGIGIAADQHTSIFRAFTQADGRLARGHEGIGMGLAYVDQMVRLLGGTIALASTPGAGSRFTITLPV